MTRPSPWWRPDVFAARRPALAARGALQAAIRADFCSEGFVEVDTPAAAGLARQRDAHLRLRGRRASTCTRRRSSPARSCWRPAPATSSPSPTPIAIASAAACTTPSSRCSSGTGWGARLPAPLAGGGARRADEGLVQGKPFRRRPLIRRLRRHLLPRGVKGVPRSTCSCTMPTVSFALPAKSRRAASCATARRGPRAAAEPEVLTIVEAFRRHAGIDLEAMLPGEPGAFESLAEATRGKKPAGRRGRHLVRPLQQDPLRPRRAEARAGGGPLFSPAIRRARRRWRPFARTTRAFPRASSSTSAASSWPMPSTSWPIPRSSAVASRRRKPSGRASTARPIRSTRIFSTRWRSCRRPAASRSASTGS